MKQIQSMNNALAKDRRALALTAILAASTLALAGCGNGDSQSAAVGENRTLRLSHFMEPTHPIETCGMATMNESLEGSGLTVETYPSAQIGSEAESLEQLASGSLDMSINGPAFLGVYYDPINVLDSAYLFEDSADYQEKMQGDAIAKLYDDMYQETGMKVFPAWYYGTRHMTSNTPLNTPEDLSGLKIRTPDAPLYISNLKAMGGTATPMALDELYLALQQGVIDAQENPIPTIDSMKLNEVQDYINLTGHMVQGISISVNGAVYDSLPSEQQEALDTAIQAGGEAAYECVTTAEVETLETWRTDETMAVNDSVDRELFAERAKPEMSSGQSWSDVYTEIQDSGAGE